MAIRRRAVLLSTPWRSRSNLMEGSDPKTSVVGTGVFPTTGTAHPTLTLAALSLRAVNAI